MNIVNHGYLRTLNLMAQLNIKEVYTLELNEVSNLIKGETGVYMMRVDKVNNSSNAPNSFTPYQKQIISKNRS